MKDTDKIKKRVAGKDSRTLNCCVRKYLLFDGRACGAKGTDEATCLVFCDSNKEAKSYKGDYGMMACYSYLTENNTLLDEKWEWDYIET